MAVVGEASIIVRAITNKFKKDVEKALKDLRPVVEKAGQQLAADFNKSFADNIDVSSVGDRIGAQIHEGVEEGARHAGETVRENISDGAARAGEDIRRNLTRAATQAGDDAGGGFTRRFADFINGDWANQAIRASQGFTKAFAVANIAGVGVAGLVGSLSAVVSGLFAMGAAASQAAGAMAVLPGMYSVLGQAGLAAKLGLGSVEDALKESAKAYKTLLSSGASAEELQKANEALTKSMQGLSEPAKEFVTQINATRKPISDMKAAIGDKIFEGGLTVAVKVLSEKALPVLQQQLSRTGTIVGGMAANFARAFTAPRNLERFRTILANNNKILGIFSTEMRNIGGNTSDTLTPIDHLVSLLLKIGRAIQPITARFATWIAGMIAAADATARVGDKTSGMIGSFERAGDTAAQLGRIFGNLFETIMGLGRASQESGRGLLDSFEQATEKLSNIVNFPTNQDKLGTYFEGVAENMRAIGDLAVVVGKQFLGLGDNSGIADMARELIPAVEGIGALADQMLGAGGAFGEFIAHLAEIVKILGDSVGFQLFFGVLNSILGAFEAIISTDLGLFLVGVVGAVAAITRAFAFARSAAQFFFKVLLGGPIGAIRNMKILEGQIASTGRTAALAGRGVAASAAASTAAMTTAAGSTVVMGQVGKAATQAGDDAAKSVGKWGKLRGALGGVKGGVGGLLAAGGLLALGGAMDNTGSTATALSNTMSGAALGFTVGGPWGAAVGAAGGLLVSFATRLDDTKRVIEEQAATARKEADAIRTITANMSQFVDAVGASMRQVGDSFRPTAATVDAVGNAIRQLGNATDDQGKRINEGLLPALQALGGNVTIRELYNGIAKGGPVFRTLQGNIKDLQTSTELQVDRLKNMKEALRQVGEGQSIQSLRDQMRIVQSEMATAANLGADTSNQEQQLRVLREAIAAYELLGENAYDSVDAAIAGKDAELARLGHLQAAVNMSRQASQAEFNRMLVERQRRIESQADDGIYAKTINRIQEVGRRAGQAAGVRKAIVEFESPGYAKTFENVVRFAAKVRATPQQRQVLFKTVGVAPTMKEIARVAAKRKIPIDVFIKNNGFKLSEDQLKTVKREADKLNRTKAEPKIKARPDYDQVNKFRSTLNSIKPKDVRVGAYLAPGTTSNILGQLNGIIAQARVNVTVVTRGVPGKAAGGQVLAGRVYEVGEVGRELFVPDGNGRIIPNHQYESMLARGSSGVQNDNSGARIVNVTINNPSPERASQSTTRTLRERVSNSGWSP